MSEIEGLIKSYQRFVSLPWSAHTSGEERVWFAVYDPSQERRLRLRIDEFRIATQGAGYNWYEIDVAEFFSTWMSGHRYRDAYFESPADMKMALKTFTEEAASRIREELSHSEVDEDTVVAVTGVATLFGLTKVSTIIEKVTSDIKGRLLVFFPGSYEDKVYRLLNARDGWNYLAIPIMPDRG